jgi:glycosyltransferase involved in cell wall biosynthesis
MDNIVVIISCSLALLGWWVVMPLRAVLHDRKLGSLGAQPYTEPAGWPMVSVLVPAKDEEHTLGAAVQSLLEIDYPALEIILVNDRSTDRTGEMVESLARRDARIRSLHIDSLPAGWLGKVHALHQGIEISRGEWLLCADADIHYSPLVLKRAIAHCLQQDRDFLALLPGFANSSPISGATQTAFGVMLLSMLDFVRVSDPRNPVAMGVGAFNLLRRSCIDAHQGLRWLRLEVADDVGLALLAKRRGARIEVLAGQDMVELDWYPTLAAMLDGVMQRCIMGANYSLARYLLNCAAICLCLAAPVGLGFALAQFGPLAWLSLASYAMPSLILGNGLKKFVIPRGLLWGLPLGFMVIAYGMLRSFFTCLRYGGVYWRGTLYPLRDLRAAQRVKMADFFKADRP